ncbi:PepSY domain-containing protein [Novosphingobium sp. TH158]|uniref:PepSY domain-containing protein n=1 Tax=Novosphingobium sp. TH158 TaxID=2067455 RepID=UPI000C7C1496|nr:PepSY domain-containing protein [Novosphingobium sp. TH158]PLK26924.1 PepSY domain-containing protein [Novosphingobium sp. TH158]
MRKWHRWLSVFFGVFLLWIAVTGTLSQVVPLVQRGGFENEAAEKAERARALAAATPPGFVCPETLTCQPKRKGGSIVGTLHHLHSGESFGPLGVVIATLSGFAMVFFAFSGLWLYIQMWRNRKSRSMKPGWFWD